MSPTQMEALRATLKPFAEEAFRYEPPESDDDNRIWDCRLVIGDLRRAAEAYATLEKEMLDRPVVAEGWRAELQSIHDVLHNARAMISDRDEGFRRIGAAMESIRAILAASPIADGVERRDVLEEAAKWHDDCAANFRAITNDTTSTAGEKNYAFNSMLIHDNSANHIRALSSPTTGAQKPCLQEVK